MDIANNFYFVLEKTMPVCSNNCCFLKQLVLNESHRAAVAGSNGLEKRSHSNLPNHNLSFRRGCDFHKRILSWVQYCAVYLFPTIHWVVAQVDTFTNVPTIWNGKLNCRLCISKPVAFVSPAPPQNTKGFVWWNWKMSLCFTKSF